MALPVLKPKSPISARKKSVKMRKSPSRCTKTPHDWTYKNIIRYTRILPPSWPPSGAERHYSLDSSTPTSSMNSEGFLAEKQDIVENAQKPTEKKNNNCICPVSSDGANRSSLMDPLSSKPILEQSKCVSTFPSRVTRPPFPNVESKVHCEEERSNFPNRSRTVPQVVIPVKAIANYHTEPAEAGDSKIWSERLRSRGSQISQIANRPLDFQEDTIEVLLASSDEIEDMKEYAVQKVAGEKIADGGIHEYLIKWVGYRKLDWVPAVDCFCLELIAEFRAAQRVARIAARRNGHDVEVGKLDRLAEAEEARAEKVKQVKEQSQQKNLRTGRSVRQTNDGAHHRDKDADTEIRETHENEASVVFVAEKTIVQCDTRVNTARMPSRCGNSIYWETPQSEKSGETLWIRPKEGEPQPGFLYRTMSRVQAWVDDTAAEIERQKEEEQVKRVRRECEEQEGRKRIAEEMATVEAATAEMAKLLEEEVRREETLNAERERLALEARRWKEQDNAAEATKCKEQEALQRKHKTITQKASPRTSHSRIPIRRIEVLKQQERSHQHQPHNPLLNTLPKPSKRPLLHIPPLPLSARNRPSPSSSSSTPSSSSSSSSSLPLPKATPTNLNFDLRQARKREKSLLRRTAPPKLVRSEFMKDMARKRAEELIGMTRPEPVVKVGLEFGPEVSVEGWRGRVEKWMADMMREDGGGEVEL